MSESNKPPKTPKLLTLKYVFSLVSGCVASGLLIALASVVVYHLIAPADDIVPDAFRNGQAMVATIASLIVFGSVYLITTFMSGNLRQAQQKFPHIKVLSIIFASLWAVPALIFLVMLVNQLVSLGVGTFIADSSDELAKTVTSSVGIIIYAKMITYHLGLWRLGGRGLYVTCFTALIALSIGLFMIFPGSAVRDAAKDEQKINDLEKIQRAIERYTDRNNQLPADLAALGGGYRLNNDISSYKYLITEEEQNTYSRYANYQLCADFLLDTGVANSYQFSYHSAGEQCFDLSELISGYDYDLPITKSSLEGSSVNYWSD